MSDSAFRMTVNATGIIRALLAIRRFLLDNSQVQKNKRPCFSRLPNYSQYYQYIILHVSKNPRIFSKKVGERVPANFKETFIKPFVNVAPKNSSGLHEFQKGYTEERNTQH